MKFYHGTINFINRMYEKPFIEILENVLLLTLRWAEYFFFKFKFRVIWKRFYNIERKILALYYINLNRKFSGRNSITLFCSHYVWYLLDRNFDWYPICSKLQRRSWFQSWYVHKKIEISTRYTKICFFASCYMW